MLDIALSKRDHLIRTRFIKILLDAFVHKSHIAERRPGANKYGMLSAKYLRRLLL